MFLHIVYASFSSQGLSGVALSDLVERSRIKNEQHGITAVLLHQQGAFLHGIEGKEAEVRALLAIVHADPRHCDAQVLVETQVSKRLFTGQPMSFHDADLGKLGSEKKQHRAPWSVGEELPGILVARLCRLADSPTFLELRVLGGGAMTILTAAWH